MAKQALKLTGFSRGGSEGPVRLTLDFYGGMSKFLEDYKSTIDWATGEYVYVRDDISEGKPSATVENSVSE